MIDIEIRKRIIRELIETWDYIGGDVLNGIAEDKVGFAAYQAMSEEQKWRANESVTMPQADVVDVVTDNWAGKARENIDRWHSLTDSEKRAIQKEAFPFKHYGY